MNVLLGLILAVCAGVNMWLAMIPTNLYPSVSWFGAGMCVWIAGRCFITALDNRRTER